MYLSKLDIVGFKSFAQKTEFKFNDGLTAIVGPNGCGKTNIVDALRWCLGEQKSAILRSDHMENVIFNGSKNRKPLGMAEVSLTLDNNKGILPTEFSEVVVTRRLFRDGDSQYLLNNTQCRLRDIVDLFMDTGMGADSYSVIELKMVEAILSGKPEERRHLLEEAAGVNKYKARKKEASKKLSTVQNDLLRISDLFQEIEKQVSVLSRQAAKTKRYNKLMEEFRELDLNLLKRDYLKYSAEIDKLKSEIATLTESRTTLDEQNITAEENIKALEIKLIELETKKNLLLEKDNLFKSQISTKKQDIAINEEKITALNANQLRNNSEIDESADKIVSIDNQIALNIEQKSKFEIENEDLAKSLNEQNEIVKQNKNELSDFRQDAQLINEEILNLQNQINNFRNSLIRNNAKIKSNNDRIQKLNDELSNLNQSISNQEVEKQRTEDKKASLREFVELAHQKLIGGQERQKTLNAEIEKLSTEINKSKTSLSSKKTELDFLSSLMDVDDTSKFILKNEAWKNLGKPTVLIEDIDAAAEYRVAIESALGDYAHIFLIDDESQAHSAFNYLKKNEKGKVSFICKSNIKEMPAPKDITQENDVIGWLSELVNVDDKLRSMLRKILNGCVLVKDFDAAKSAINSGKCSTAVTLAGEIIKNDGFIKGGGISKKEGLSVGKNERINKLKIEISNIESLLKENEEILKELKSEVSEINIYNLSNEMRKAEAEENKNLQLISQFDYKIDSLNKNFEMIEQNLKGISNENLEQEQEIESINQNFEEYSNQLYIKKEEFTVFQSSLSTSEKNVSEAEKKAKDIEMNIIRINAEIHSLITDNQKLEVQKSEIKFKAERLKSEIESNIIEIANLKNKIAITAEELESLNQEATLVQNDKDFVTAEIHSIEQQIQQYSNDLSAMRKNHDRLTESIHHKELSFTEINSSIKTYRDKAQENYEVFIDNYEIDLEQEFNYNEARMQLTALKERLSSIGNVNFMALKEFEEATERYDFYDKQLKDLHESEKLLVETIEEIDKNALARFLDTFTKVQQNFVFLFTKLFGPEGFAELKLSSDDALEADIEIIARPPGKKPHSIEMLSGGEKTLTAISLLFAIYLVKPSPFCILDEVDAPLDDANIDKFLQIIREFSKETQFLIVSHNKRTMELSDTLYGITMAEEGVSKVVSVRLSQEAI
jgi:chromosome segregation protein